MKLKQYRLDSHRTKVLFLIMLVLLTLYFLVIPKIYFKLMRYNCEKQIQIAHEYVKEYFSNFRNDILIKGMSYGIEVMKPLYCITIPLFSLLILTNSYEKHKRINILMFFNIAIFSMIPVFVFSNTYGYYVFNQDDLCEPFYETNVGLYLFKYALNIVIVCSILRFYIVITFLKKSTWKTIDLVCLEIILCLFISILLPMQLI